MTPLQADLGMPSSTRAPTSRSLTLVAYLLLLLAFVELFRTLWISDDAAISLRTVLNFVNGYGARFNVDERVQAYTHPLWFLLISAGYAIVGQLYYVTWALCFVCTGVALWLLMFRATSELLRGITLALLALMSKAFFDYSHSGLENPLSHLIVVLTILAARNAILSSNPRALYLASLLAGSIYLSRPDLPLLVGPLMLYLLALRSFSFATKAKSLALAGLPIMLWSGISLVYYGVIFPNTAYAKLNIAIPLGERAVRGLYYLVDSFNRDPVTLLVILAGFYAGLRARGHHAAIAIGGLAYVVYVVSIGGDFMSGRLMTPVLVAALMILATSPLVLVSVRACAVSLAIAALLSVWAHQRGGVITPQSKLTIYHGITDQRRMLKWYSLRDGIPGVFEVPPWTIVERSVGNLCGGLGIVGIKTGPGMHLIDECALSDPLLARIPPRTEPNWHPGHFARILPTNYFASVRNNDNRLIDPDTRALYDSIRSVTRDPLFGNDRWRHIVAINATRQWLPLAVNDRHRKGELKRQSDLPARKASTIQSQGECPRWDHPSHLSFEDRAEITLDTPTAISSIDLLIDGADEYSFEYWSGSDWVAMGKLAPSQRHNLAMCDLTEKTLKLNAATPTVNKIRVIGLVDHMYAIGRIRINP
jgi:arabinofuranosyltransferase